MGGRLRRCRDELLAALARAGSGWVPNPSRWPFDETPRFTGRVVNPASFPAHKRAKPPISGPLVWVDETRRGSPGADSWGFQFDELHKEFHTDITFALLGAIECTRADVFDVITRNMYVDDLLAFTISPDFAASPPPCQLYLPSRMAPQVARLHRRYVPLSSEEKRLVEMVIDLEEDYGCMARSVPVSPCYSCHI